MQTDRASADTDRLDPSQLLETAEAAAAAARQFIQAARTRLSAAQSASLGQFASHGLAWMAAYVATLEAALDWARTLDAQNRFGRLEQLTIAAGFGEYLAQLQSGIAMSQDEIVRPAHLGIEDLAQELGRDPAVAMLVARGIRRLAEPIIETCLQRDDFGDPGLDETLRMVADQFRAFADERIAPHAGEWHGKDLLIPDEILAEMSALGVFGLTIAETHGGLGLGKLAMCVVTEELSRGYIGVGSLGTRAEIAAELIQSGGTAAQKARYLPAIASGEVLPTAVFTEPNTGSDLASLKTRAVREDGGFRIHGAKTWITHAARSDLMVLLARTDPEEPGHRGLTMFLAEKTRGREGEPFPDPGLDGAEIPVLGYRGMKEYELGFDGFFVPEEAVLGQEEGRGFKQLMATFESARIQTAARAIGVAQNALELAFAYARERIQFGRPIIAFERIYGKLAWMAVEIQMVRQLVHAAARKKDEGVRCDVEAGMAKLLAARLAWSAADNGVQIHGGNGYALEYPISRVLCDARILNIFEGAAEIQAEIIARGLLRSERQPVGR
jgi:(2S)-methylsuccinyl-CoA dehydrogenase